MQVIADGRNSNTAGTAIGYVSSIVEHSTPTGRATTAPRRRRCGSSTRAWYNPNLETRWFMIPGMIGTLTLIQTMMLTAMSVAREREQGTFDQLLVTPFRPFEIMAGKALPSMLVGTIQAGGVLLVAQLWFRIPFAGSYLTLYAGLLLFLLAAVGIGLLVSAVAATMQQAMLYSMLLIMPFSLLSGLTTPISSMPTAAAVSDRDQSAALRDRHHAARVSRGSGARFADCRSVAAGAARARSRCGRPPGCSATACNDAHDAQPSHPPNSSPVRILRARRCSPPAPWDRTSCARRRRRRLTGLPQATAPGAEPALREHRDGAIRGPRAPGGAALTIPSSTR